MSGFIDPKARDSERLDRVELLLDEVLRTVPIDALSPEAQRLLSDLRSGDVARRQRARGLARRLADADPLPRSGGMVGTMRDPYDRTRNCPCRPENGGSGICGCILGQPVIT